jgi:hypothetical protein
MASLRSCLVILAGVSLLALTHLSARSATAGAETVRLASGSVISLQTPAFVQVGKRYAITWAGGGPPQTYTIKARREDGWVQVDVAEENVNPVYLVPGEFPTRWLNVATAVSIQEMRPHQY